ncbi:hydroxymethylglutaryl-CoA lyase [Streptomyces sp. NPDC057199]|uniref:hydroxymethylglutaryl-CoA lyase n=1 Tax=Streptomyces sp. NPDC057199 TaxID=3346047 RepID=UPI003629B855
MTAPALIQVCECWARDGLQSWPDVVSLEDKLSVLRQVAAAGVREIDATSLVPPKYAPQFTDAEDVLAAVVDTGVRTRVLTPNLRGVERAIDIRRRLAGGVDTIGFPVSASEAHNVANVRRTHDEHLREIERMVGAAHEAGLAVLAAVATAFGCPLTGPVAEDVVFSLADRLVDLGVDRIMLSDTTGLADPVRVAAYTTRAIRDYPGVDLVAHFHDTRGAGIANTYAAVASGVRCVDACLGGIGGEPASVEQNHAGETGNVSTEDLVVLLERAGFDTGVDVDVLLMAGRHAERLLGAPGRSQVQRTGPGLDARAPRSQHRGADLSQRGQITTQGGRP